MNNTTDLVEVKFTVTDKGAPIFKVIYDKNSESVEQKLLGVLLKNAKSNNWQLVVEPKDSFSDGKENFEIKVLGT